MRIRVKDGGEFVHTVGRTDDGSDESIMSARLAKRVVLNGICKMTKIERPSLQVALKEDYKAKAFSFSAHGRRHASFCIWRPVSWR